MRPCTCGLLSKQHCSHAAVQRYVGRMVRWVGPWTRESNVTTASILRAGTGWAMRGRELGPEYTARRAPVKGKVKRMSPKALGDVQCVRSCHDCGQIGTPGRGA